MTLRIYIIMCRTILLLPSLFLVVAVVGFPGRAHSEPIRPLPQQSFELFKTTYSKKYNSPSEESLRRSIFEQNLQHIEKHNEEASQGMHSYTLGINQFADM